MNIRHKISIVFFSISVLILSCSEEEIGLNSLIVTTNEPSGTNCANGGQKIDVGIDKNRNNVLEANEIQSSSFICNGNNGLSTLTKVLDEGAGANCENGGLKIQVGSDVNRNGILDDGEIQTTNYICKPTVENIRKYLIESNEQIVKNDNSWTSYLTTNITVDKDASSVLVSLDMSATGVQSSPEIAFRGKLGDQYSSASLVKWVTYNALEKPHFDFLFENVTEGQYETGVQWNAITGGITTSQYQQSNSYNRLIVLVFP